MNGYTVAWIVWFVLCVASFFVIEIMALRRKNRDDGRPDTLTSHIQLLTRARVARDIGAGVLLGFVGWFAFHLWV